ncbi:MAG: hypothetical protein ABIO48_10745 [Pedococcus sp.]
MESTDPAPRPDEAAALLAEADESVAQWAGRLSLPPLFHSAIGAAIAVQIATAAYGIAVDTPRARVALGAGLLVFAATAVVQLLRFRARNGVWVSGLASRVVLGTGNASTTAYLLAFGAAVWAAFEDRWWLVGLSAIVGGAAYTLGGRHWWRQYQGDPSAHSRSASLAFTAGAVVVALAGLVLLLVEK